MKHHTQLTPIIQHLDNHPNQQPTLQTLAQHLKLTPTQLQQKIRHTTKTNPQHFLQALTRQHTQTLLQQNHTPNPNHTPRLHNLTLTLTPPDTQTIQTQGANLTIHYATTPTPFGNCFIAHNQNTIYQLTFPKPDQPPPTQTLQKTWPQAQLKPNQKQTQKLATQILQPNHKNKQTTNLQLQPRGTPLQTQTWQTLLTLPQQTLTHYTTIAKTLNKPTATRAIANAIAANPIAILIPCHRILHANGDPKGYRWGNGLKRTLIAWENTLPQQPT